MFQIMDFFSANPQSNRSRGNYNNNYRGRGNNNRGFSHWNQQGYPRQTAPSAPASYTQQTHSRGHGLNNNRGRGNGPPRYQNQRYQQPQAQQQQNVQPIQQRYYNAGNYNNPQQQVTQQMPRCYICHEDHHMNNCQYRFNIPRFQNLHQLEEEGPQGTQEETYPGYPNYLDPNSQQQ
jgi:hypothetical protein